MWGEVPIFATSDGRAYNVREYSRRIKAYGKAAGLDITAYSLRHAAALLFLRRGGGAFALQNLLGHSTMAMTKHYIHLTQEDTRREHKAAGVVLHLVGEKEVPKNTRLRKI